MPEKGDLMQQVAERAVPPPTSQGLRDRMVTVACGTRDLTDTYAGKPIAWIRAEVAETLQIPEGAIAILDGQPVPRDREQFVLVDPGQSSLEFVQRTGTKG